MANLRIEMNNDQVRLFFLLALIALVFLLSSNVGIESPSSDLLDKGGKKIVRPGESHSPGGVIKYSFNEFIASPNIQNIHGYENRKAESVIQFEIK
jgi:hypothetical protein